MATQTVNPHTPSPFSRLSRLGINLGFGSKMPSSSPQREKSLKKGNDEDWYIAYNGPYEVPADTRKRDSWGDIIEDDPDEVRDAILDADLLQRYGGIGRGSGRMSDDTGHNTRVKTRGRAYSGTSRTTNSSGAFDTNQRSASNGYSTAYGGYGGHPYAANSTATRRTNGSASTGYISLDAAGGVGESPMPRQQSPPPIVNTRTSLAGLFFGGPSSAPLTSGQKTTTSREPSVGHRKRRSMSLDLPPEEAKHRPDPIMPPPPNKHEDYFNSYYSTLIGSPESHHTFGAQPRRTGYHQPQLSKSSTDDAHTARTHQHPYAYTFPPKAGHPSTSTAPPPPLTPIPMSRPVTSPHLHTIHTSNTSGFTGEINPHKPPPHTATGSKPSLRMRKPSHINLGLKSSASVPNLKNEKASLQSSIPSGVDRWLSAETWCDAMLFPRPRFKVKQSLYTSNETRASGSGSGSGRIVSPPGTPMPRSPGADGYSHMQASGHGHGDPRSAFAMQGAKERSLHPDSSSSRQQLRQKLTKSRSAVSLRSTAQDLATETPVINPTKFSGAVRSNAPDKPDLKGKARLQAPRPQEVVVLNDASAPPSLDQVIDEGERFEDERKEWQAKATSSFGNKATRNRSKSLNYKEARRRGFDRGGGKPMGNIDFIAARTLLGSQGIASSVRRTPAGSQTTRTDTATVTTSSAKTHSRSASHAHSGSQMSSQGHSPRKHGSWGQGALKIGALCGLQDEALASPPAVSEAVDIAQPSKRQEQTIAPEGVEYLSPQPVDHNSSRLRVRIPSPVPSGIAIGLAISTPPASDAHSHQIHGTVRSIPDHPYAQSSHPYQFITTDSATDSPVRRTDYAGPHPTSPKLTSPPASVGVSDMATRHRLPPQATMHVQQHPHIVHPYAMGSQSSSRPQMSSLPVAIPPPNIHIQHAYARISTGDPEILGVGEALSSLNRNTSRENVPEAVPNLIAAQNPYGSQFEGSVFSSDAQPSPIPKRVRRKPVSYLSHESSTSPEIQDQNATLTIPRLDREVSYSSVGDSSGSSPSRSPQPLGNVEDLAQFHDLFYKPSEPSEPSSPINFRTGVRSASNDIFPVGSTQSFRSGLSSLARKLTVEYEDRISREYPHEREDRQRREESRIINAYDDDDFIMSGLPKLRTSSPLQMGSPLPMRFGGTAGNPEDMVPEDIQSSRASSLLEMLEPSEEDDTFGLPFRFGAIEAVTTPPAIVHDHKHFGRHLSFTADAIGEANLAHMASERVLSTATSLSPISGDALRTSYLTSTSEGSRMSGLSDFPQPPAPPLHLTPAHTSILQSYFAETPLMEGEDPFARILPTHPHPHYRMTFGGDEDTETGHFSGI